MISYKISIQRYFILKKTLDAKLKVLISGKFLISYRCIMKFNFIIILVIRIRISPLQQCTTLNVMLQTNIHN